MEPNIEQPFGLMARVSGAVVGAALLDMYGGPIEGMDFSKDPKDNLMLQKYLRDPKTTDEIKEWAHACINTVNYVHANGGFVKSYLWDFNRTYLQRGSTTDDTGRNIVLLDSLARVGHVDIDDFLAETIEWGSGGAAIGIGGTTSLAIGKMDPEQTNSPYSDFRKANYVLRTQGKEWFLGWGMRSKSLAKGNKPRHYEFGPSPSNGVAMFIHGLGVFYAGCSDEVMQREMFSNSDAITTITHGYPSCLEVSRVVVALTRELILTGDIQRSYEKIHDQFPKTMDHAQRTLRSRGVHYAGGAYETLGIALEALRTSSNFEDVMFHVLNASQLYGPWATDVDTYGCLAGAFGGAAYSIDAISSELLYPVLNDGTPVVMQPLSVSSLVSLSYEVWRQGQIYSGFDPILSRSDNVPNSPFRSLS